MASKSWRGPIASDVKPLSLKADYHCRLRYLLLFLAANVTAQTPPASANTGVATLSGAVTNSVTGLPVLRAHVSITLNSAVSQRQYGAITNGEGQFTITQLPPGHYTVSVERAGF